jgi:hypothetical protein
MSSIREGLYHIRIDILNRESVKEIPSDVISYLNIVKCVSKAGFDPHSHNDFVFRIACIYGCTRTVKFLLNIGDTNIHGREGDFDWVDHGGQVRIIKLLIESGVDIHANYDYELTLAVINNRYRAVELLLKSGADVHANNANNDNLIITACRKDILKWLNYLSDMELMFT